jgi:hypothetical protein
MVENDQEESRMTIQSPPPATAFTYEVEVHAMDGLN